MRKHIYPNI